jgi:hypothetical protein
VTPGTLGPGTTGSADFSPDRRYRYRLTRQWDAGAPRFTFVLLNPSRADAEHDDVTVRRLTAIASHAGAGGFDLVNLFARCDTAQDTLHLPEAVEDRPGHNRDAVARSVASADVVVVGWGDGRTGAPFARERRAAVRRQAAALWPLLGPRAPRCLRVLRSGAPGFPGRLAGSSPLLPYVPPSGYP